MLAGQPDERKKKPRKISPKEQKELYHRRKEESQQRRQLTPQLQLGIDPVAQRDDYDVSAVSKIRELLNENIKLHGENSRMANELRVLRAEVDGYEKDMRELVQQYRNKIFKKQDEDFELLDRADERAAELIEELKEKNEEIRNAKLDRDYLTQKSEDLEKELTESKTGFKQTQEDLSVLRNKYSSRLEQLEQILSDKSNLEKFYQKKQEQVGMLGEAMDDLDARHLELTQLYINMQKLQKASQGRADSQDSEAEKLRAEIHRQLLASIEAEKRYEKRRKIIETLEEESTIKNQVIERLDVKLEKSRSRLTDVVQKAYKHASLSKLLKQEIQETRQEHAKLEIKYQSALVSQETLKTAIAMKIGHVYVTINEVIEAVRKMADEYDATSMDQEITERKLRETMGQLHILTQELSKKEHELETALKQKAEVKSEIGWDSDGKYSDEEEKLEDIEEELESKDY